MATRAKKTKTKKTGTTKAAKAAVVEAAAEAPAKPARKKAAGKKKAAAKKAPAKKAAAKKAPAKKAPAAKKAPVKKAAKPKKFPVVKPSTALSPKASRSVKAAADALWEGGDKPHTLIKELHEVLLLRCLSEAQGNYASAAKLFGPSRQSVQQYANSPLRDARWSPYQQNQRQD